MTRRKSSYRATTKSGRSTRTKYFTSAKSAYRHAKAGRTGTVSRLNRKTNRFRKIKKFGWS